MRKVINPPIVKGFKPYGPDSGKFIKEPVNLLYEEYEALRLCDYDTYNHLQASQIMCVSRPTFTRIYSSARIKIALAFVEGRQIVIEGGKIYFDSDWYACSKCNCFFNNPEKDKEIKACPLCGSNKIQMYDYEFTDITEPEINDNDLCVCPRCANKQMHEHGKPCKDQYCIKCNTRMVRKRNNQ
ncbi:MAG TPA: hypothetical protein DEH02_15850 [Bacteroidales bacterium]|nr:hypothetical protein [Bacteroidales bacterium]